MTESAVSRDRSADATERWAVLHELEDWLQTPMVLLSFTWLVLVVVEIVWGSTRLLEVFGTIIWIVFILEFALRLSLAPHKTGFLRSNWITVIALLVPAFRMVRVLRFVRAARALRSFRLVRIIGTANRGVNALRASLGRRGLGYVLGVTILMTFLGAAGMLAFEPAAEVEGGFRDYGDALWWTAMLLTTMGSQYWPQTGEGRVLCFLLALYGFAVFGYITASFASFFIGQEAKAKESDVAGSGDIADLKEEVARLRAELRERPPAQEAG